MPRGIRVYPIIFFCQGNEDLIIVHEALEYGDCRLSLAVSLNYDVVKLLDSGIVIVMYNKLPGVSSVFSDSSIWNI